MFCRKRDGINKFSVHAEFRVGLLWAFMSLTIFQSYCNLEVGDTQSLKFKWRDWGSNLGPLALRAKSLTTRPSPLPKTLGKRNAVILSTLLLGSVYRSISAIWLQIHMIFTFYKEPTPWVTRDLYVLKFFALRLQLNTQVKRGTPTVLIMMIVGFKPILVADLISPSTKSCQCTRFDSWSWYFCTRIF